jgi:competence protein ComEA
VPDDPFEPSGRRRVADLDPLDALDVIEPDDPAPGGVLHRPATRPAALARLAAQAEPWVAWFGVRRLAATVATVVVVVAAGWWLLRAPAPPTEAGLPRAVTASSAPTVSGPPAEPAPAPTTTSTSRSVLVVHVAGAVAAPGVYELPGAARAADAVTAAGGATADAELDALNLAAPLQDGERVYVPIVGEPLPPPAPVSPGSANAPALPPGPVNVNRAAAEELQGLPGVGPATAQAIVADREANGPFASVDELERVRGIGPAKLAVIRPLVTV